MLHRTYLEKMNEQTQKLKRTKPTNAPKKEKKFPTTEDAPFGVGDGGGLSSEWAGAGAGLRSGSGALGAGGGEANCSLGGDAGGDEDGGLEVVWLLRSASTTITSFSLFLQ